MGLVPIVVGERWPHGARPDGMQAMIQPAGDALDVTLACHVGGVSAGELSALRSRPLRLGVWASPPLTWLLLSAQGDLSLDAPYAVGITSAGHASAIRAGAAALAEVEAPARLLVTVAVIDRGVTRALRGVSVSADWARALAAGVLAGPERLTQADYLAAVERDQRLTTMEMFAAAQAVESAGRM